MLSARMGRGNGVRYPDVISVWKRPIIRTLYGVWVRGLIPIMCGVCITCRCHWHTLASTGCGLGFELEVLFAVLWANYTGCEYKKC